MLNLKIVSVTLITLTCASTAVSAGNGNWQYVSGTGIHYESDGIEHSVEPTDYGLIRRSTDIVELSGDLVGRAVFQPVSEVNLNEGKIVNTGSQVFSGTVLGSDPVLLGDKKFRFDIDLNTGETTGDIFLTDRISGPNIRCILEMRGTGRTAEGYNLSNYWGMCKIN
jgi:hypothetical protein